MSDIKAGDLVYVVRDCCNRYVGHVFRVAAVVRDDLANCGFCGHWAKGGEQLVATNAEQGELINRLPVQWLRRIPPLAELWEKEQASSMPEKVPA